MTTKIAKTKRKGVTRVGSNALVVPIRTEKQALDYLRENHPEFFESHDSRELAAIIVMEMSEELAKHSAVERAGMIAAIMALMYQMGTAALKTIRDEKHRNMARILVDDYRHNVEMSNAVIGSQRQDRAT